MIRPPLILISPDVEKQGDGFGDLSTILLESYQPALMGCGAIPMALPATLSRELCVSRCDGVLLTGGEDVEPRLRGTVTVTPDGGARDLHELLLIDEVFRQRKPLLAICRGHQMLNVALGGTLVVDILAQMPRGHQSSPQGPAQRGRPRSSVDSRLFTGQDNRQAKAKRE